jgi:hypothetical protein
MTRCAYCVLHLVSLVAAAAALTVPMKAIPELEIAAVETPVILTTTIVLVSLH